MKNFQIAIATSALLATSSMSAPVSVDLKRNLVDDDYCVPMSFNLKTLALTCRGEKPMALLNSVSLFPKRASGESAMRYVRRIDAYVAQAQNLFGRHLMDRGGYNPTDSSLSFATARQIACSVNTNSKARTLSGWCSFADPDGLVVTGGIDIACVLVGAGLAKFTRLASKGYRTNCESSLRRLS